MAYQSDHRPQLRLEDARNSLPCREDIWDSHEEEWQQGFPGKHISQCSNKEQLIRFRTALFVYSSRNALQEKGRLV